MKYIKFLFPFFIFLICFSFNILKVYANIDLTIANNNEAIINYHSDPNYLYEKNKGYYFEIGIINLGTESAPAFVSKFQTSQYSCDQNGNCDYNNVTDYPVFISTPLNPQSIELIRTTISSSTNSLFIRACVDSNGAIVESNENNNCGTWQKFDFITPPVPKPDIVAQIVGPQNPPTEGKKYEIKAGIVNTEETDVPMTFTSIVQTAKGFDSSNNPIGLTDQSFLIENIASFRNAIKLPLRFDAGGNSLDGYPFDRYINIPTSVDKFNFRLCVDKNSSSDSKGVVDELNETNNCTQWFSTTVCPINTSWDSAISSCKSTENICLAPTTQNVTVTCDLKNGIAATSGSVIRSQTKVFPGCTFGSPVTVDNSTYVSDTCVYPVSDPCNGNGANNPPLCNMKCS